MEHYVTLFDSLFLPQGLALHRSLQRHAGVHCLWILCVDDDAYQVLAAMALPDIRLLRLQDVETPELLAVKSTRSRGEYCWTLTPFAPRFVFEADPQVSRVTYLDADLWFRSSPADVFRVLDRSGKGVLITDHLPAPEHDHSADNGRFCVQFLTFVRGRGDRVRAWWEARCIEWCFARFEDGRFGDQKYLDVWPELFGDEVHVLSSELPVLGPWNASRFPYSSAFAVHFHGLRLLDDGDVLIADNYDIPELTFRKVYRPYFVELSVVLGALARAGHALRPQAKRPGLKARVLSLLRRSYWKLRVAYRPSVHRLPRSSHGEAD